VILSKDAHDLRKNIFGSIAWCMKLFEIKMHRDLREMYETGISE
jgi:hypothetical protein